MAISPVWAAIVLGCLCAASFGAFCASCLAVYSPTKLQNRLPAATGTALVADLERRQREYRIVARFYFIRLKHELRKRPSTSELLDWIQALTVSGIDAEELNRRLPFLGVLLKMEEDVAKLSVR